MIVPPPKTFEALIMRNKEISEGKNGMSWYLIFKNPNKCEKITDNENCKKLN